jgi:hypothetical protein
MIDYYYVQHGGDSFSFDEPMEPHPISPTLPPLRRPDADSPIWSYSEDEKTESPESSPTNPPSPKPSFKVSPPMGQCVVRVMLDQCSTLLESVEPKEECDCYNFCGGIYLGCCAIDEPCPLTCEVLGGFVAGCSFGGTSSPVSVNPKETEVPTMSPSEKLAISERPTTLGTSPSTSTSTNIPGPPSDVPRPSQTLKPTSSPTQFFPPPGGDTDDMPTTDAISIPLSTFTLEYEIAFSRPIAQSDLVVLTSITNSYLQQYMSAAFQSDSVKMADFVTEYDSFLEDPGSSVVLVTFKSTAFFDPSTGELPSRIDLEKELASAFQGVALSGYLGRVRALPASNAFSKTSQIFMITSLPTVSTLESREFSSVAAATAIFAVAIVTSLAALSWYRTRRRRRRLEASDKFLRDNTASDSLRKTRSVRESSEEQTGLNGSEKLPSIKLLEEIERIEDMRRDFDDQSVDKKSMDHDNISRRSSFESGETDLYEDDTIEDYDDDSLGWKEYQQDKYA